jgi:four helix bundle protein
VAGYGDLLAYRRAVELADDLRAVVGDWPKLDQWTLGVQLIRSADSVGANIAEAFGRSSVPDQLRFLLIARGSAYETQHWIERAVARSLLPAEGFRGRAASAGQLLNGLHRSVRRRAQTTSNEQRATGPG